MLLDLFEPLAYSGPMPSPPVASSKILYTYKNCSTCRDVVKWLERHRVSFVEKPIYETPPTVPELKRMLAFQGGQIRRLFNTSGLEYRAQGLAARLSQLSEAEALALLAGNGRLVKRPFFLSEKFGLVGFDSLVWTEAIQR